MMEAVIKVIEALAGQPWALVAVIGLAGIGYLISMLIKNTAITSALANRIGEGDVVAMVREIRTDQLLNNAVRQVQGEAITKIEKRLGLIEQDVEELKCSRVGCHSRMTDKTEGT
jgi:hypothetical protein